jgi:FkbM family methyltransferase
MSGIMMQWLGKLAMAMNYSIRRHPSRFLYRDSLLGRFVDETEIAYFRKDWGKGVIWDVGASVGKYTTMLAKNSPNATIYAFEPNLNSLYYLANRTEKYPNVVIVPNALTPDGGTIMGSHDPDFSSKPTGPRVATISLKEAVAKFGAPTFLKMDIEGAEFEVLKGDLSSLHKSTLLVSWHCQFTGKPVPQVPGWKNTQLSADITLLEPL